MDSVSKPVSCWCCLLLKACSGLSSGFFAPLRASQWWLYSSGWAISDLDWLYKKGGLIEWCASNLLKYSEREIVPRHSVTSIDLVFASTSSVLSYFGGQEVKFEGWDVRAIGISLFGNWSQGVSSVVLLSEPFRALLSLFAHPVSLWLVSFEGGIVRLGPEVTGDSINRKTVYAVGGFR